MAQLSDDSFAFGDHLIGPFEAVRLIASRIRPVEGSEAVALGAAQGRILAEDVFAPVSVPSFDNSAVDGYAVRHADLAGNATTQLAVSARIPAGMVDPPALKAGTAVRIFTGAPMPTGGDTVFMQEDVREDNGIVSLPSGLKMGANRRFSGEDFAQGQKVLAAGTRLDARRLAALAALGLAEVRVRRRVRVALFSTGDELVPPGGVLRSGAQYDSNRTLLSALLAERGALVSDLGILPDRRAIIGAALDDAARQHDVILTSGGVSTGEEDHVKAAVEERGALNFWRLAIKPGRPVAMGTIHGAAFVGLPGNPVASFVTFVRLAGPMIDHLAGAEPRFPAGFAVRADFSHAKKAGRTEYLRGSLRGERDHLPVVGKYDRDGAALISSLIGSDGLIELDPDITRVEPGAIVRFLPFETLM